MKCTGCFAIEICSRAEKNGHPVVTIVFSLLFPSSTYHFRRRSDIETDTKACYRTVKHERLQQAQRQQYFCTSSWSRERNVVQKRKWIVQVGMAGGMWHVVWPWLQPAPTFNQPGESPQSESKLGLAYSNQPYGITSP